MTSEPQGPVEDGRPRGYARPGHAHRRADLAAPIDDRLFFAGEATSIDSFATAAGAYLTGIAAAAAARSPKGLKNGGYILDTGRDLALAR